jgi:uncharacterized protein (DUF58 family)
VRRAGAVALAGLALTLIALTFDAAPLLVPGAAFLALGLAAPAWVAVSARPVTLARRLASERVVEDEPLQATVLVRRGLLAPPAAQLLEPLAAEPISLGGELSLLRGRRSTEIRILARFPRRGRRRLPPPRLRVHDPLELASWLRRARGGEQEVLVLPRTEPVHWRPRGGASGRLEGRQASEPQSAVEIDGLRPYRPGTPASRIHWPALARGAGLLERRLSQDGDTRPLVVLDARPGASLDHLDAAVRAAASLALELARGGGCRVLLPGERRAHTLEADLAGWDALHARLALVEPDSRPPLIGPAARRGPVYYVTARRCAQLPALLSAQGRGAALVVLPLELEGPSAGGGAQFEVSGCRGYLVAVRQARRRGERVAGEWAA